MKRLIAPFALLTALGILAARTVAADPSPLLNIVGGSSIRIEGKPSADAKIYANTEKTVIVACVPGEYVYKVYRKEKRVSALKRSTVLVTRLQCRPVEGAVEHPMAGHQFAEIASTVSFNDLAGDKIVLAFPGGTLR